MDLSTIEFTKLERDTDNGSRLSVDATYHINNKGKGTLRFTRNGRDKITKIIGTDHSKLFDLFINKETQCLAFQVSETGKFKLSGPSGEKITLIYENLSRAFRKETNYMLVESPVYDFVLIPETMYSQLQTTVQTQPETVQMQAPVTEAEKTEEAQEVLGSTESSASAKKSRGKKKPS